MNKREVEREKLLKAIQKMHDLLKNGKRFELNELSKSMKQVKK
ncbi:hypothetical protein [Acinetobacter sp. NIPH 817]|nr:hypothetical protein [Acinetobacter sp. NIPH 817]ENV02420.1 hypothetical protein F968_02476 [Acinetobacter sp. NIPH 817]